MLAARQKQLLSLAIGDVCQAVTLSVHGVEGKSQQVDGLTDAERYSVVTWREFKIHLRDFKYDESIEIVVDKK